MARPGRETVLRLRPTGAPTRHGERGPEAEAEIRRCHLIPRTSTEDDGRANTVIVGVTLIAPGGTDLKATDRIRWRELVYEVEGEPGNYEKNGRSVVVIAALKRVEG